ncbi:short-chain dehydrogenase [Aspergillus venezuelensis]
MGLCRAAHTNPQGAGDARPTTLQIIADEGLHDKLAEKTIVITGATGGLGIEIVRALAATGATLLLTGRDMAKAQQVLFDSGVVKAGPRVRIIQMDNASLGSVQTAAHAILAALPRNQNGINALICNVGMAGPPSHCHLTADGHPCHYAVNNLSHFLLFQMLKHALLDGSSPEFPSLVMMVSSCSHRAVQHFQFGGEGYTNSKLAMIYMASEIERRFGEPGVHATSVHPGIVITDLVHSVHPGMVKIMLGNEQLRVRLKSAEQGAATIVLAAVGSEWANKGGRYLENCEEAKPGKDDGDALEEGFVRLTYDPEAEARLWEESVAMVRVHMDVKGEEPGKNLDSR